MNSSTTASEGNSFVPIQLTDITPVRVFDVHGEYLDTEIDLDTPVRVLQLAIEDYFKVKSEVQLLLHNRRPIDPNRTLRENGCLLLKGDPYVRLVFSIKRGPVLNLVCHLCNTHEVVPIACPESNTVWELKKLLCEEIAYKRGHSNTRGRKTIASGPTPQQVRLLWRYIELSDKATLHYYRIPTNSVLSVMMRRMNSNVVEHRLHSTLKQPREAAKKAAIVVNPCDYSSTSLGSHPRAESSPPLLPLSSYSPYTNYSPPFEESQIEQPEIRSAQPLRVVVPPEVGARIQELEETVMRFHGYLERALTLI